MGIITLMNPVNSDGGRSAEREGKSRERGEEAESVGEKKIMTRIRSAFFLKFDPEIVILELEFFCWAVELKLWN